MSYTAEQRNTILALARDSISCGLDQGHALAVDPSRFDDDLQAVRACFVTLHKQGALRGCIGSLNAHRALVTDIAENAYAAAFRDPRFAPVTRDELAELDISVSILTPAQPMQFKDEQDLIEQLRPGEDGLILEDDTHRGTFLPAVWQQLPQAADFLRHLKIKAGLPPDYWSQAIRVSRYHAQNISA